MRARAPWRRRRGGPDRRTPRRDARGFALLEALVASTILMIVVVSVTNLLIDSLGAAVVSRQRETAASIASDTIENAKALGQANLANTIPASCPAPGVIPSGPGLPYAAVPALTSATFTTPYSVVVDRTTYVVCTAVTISSTSADTVAVAVSWANGNDTFDTSGEVGV